MYQISDIKGIIFDYGGTLDTGGCHWGKMLWHAYQRAGVPVTEQLFRAAYIHAERTLGKNPIIQHNDTFRQTLSKKIELELGYLFTAYGLRLTALLSWTTSMHRRVVIRSTVVRSCGSCSSNGRWCW